MSGKAFAPNKEQTCVIIGALQVGARAAAFLPAGAYIIAADGGLGTAQKLGVQVDLAIGDWDSGVQPQGASYEVQTLPHEKDDTDTHFAARTALERGFRRVVILGALGGRLDHTAATVSTLLFLAENGVQASAHSENESAHIALNGMGVTLENTRQSYFSVFPLRGQSMGVCIEGAFYPLENATLDAAFPVGVSNEFATRVESVNISAETGALLVLEIFD